tara:strand:- start:163 stop:309 length:147 start_codon:yes stop_codon:yes gene_type:complete
MPEEIIILLSYFVRNKRVILAILIVDLRGNGEWGIFPVYGPYSLLVHY